MANLAVTPDSSIRILKCPIRLDDKNQLVIGDKCPIHVRAAGIYNFILNQPKHKKYKMKL